MTFQINGNNGKYDNLTSSDESSRYGRNAVDNHFEYMKAPLVNDMTTPPPILDFMPSAEGDKNNEIALNDYIDKNDAYLKSLPPLEYEYRYMPQKPAGQIDKQALLGAAYEEMGQVEELPLKEFEEKFMIDNSMTAKPIDINNDGKITNKEYATTILAADILSKGSDDVKNVDGTISNKGMNAVLAYSKMSNADAAAKLYSTIYDTYNLGE